MEDVFYIVLSESDLKSRFANKRNAKLAASELVLKTPSERFFVLESACVAEKAPPVSISDIKASAEQCE